MAALQCKPAGDGRCKTHEQTWFVVDEHEFEGCIVGAAEYIRQLELAVGHYTANDADDILAEQERTPVVETQMCSGLDNDNADE